jgi:imidazolonepropionase-like amidohydrolase
MALAFLTVIGIVASSMAVRSQGQQAYDPSYLRFGRPAPNPAGIAVRAGRMFDAQAGTMLTNQVILIKDEVITDVGPADRIQIPTGATVIDLSRGTVLPGLIDHHLHLMDSISSRLPNDAAYVTRGIALGMHHMQGGYTTVVDMGTADSYAGLEMRNAVNRGWIPGPRIQMAGPPINPRANGIYPAPSGMVPFAFGPFEPGARGYISTGVNSAGSAREAVRERSWYGVDWIKIYATEDFAAGGDSGGGFGGAWYPDGKMIAVPSLTEEEITAAADEARRRGLKTAAHVYGGEGLRSVLRAGVDLPMHVTVGISGALGLDDETIRLFKQPLPNGKMRMVLQTLWDLEDRKPGCDWTKMETCSGNGMNTSDTRRTGGLTSRMKATELSFRRLHEAGVKQVFGSGAHQGNQFRPAGDQSMQFLFYVKWGMTPVEAIQTATINAAESLNNDWGKKVGTIEKGKFADLMGVAGNPLTDINEMLRPKFVMKGGVVYRDELTSAAPRPTTTSAQR